MTLTNDMIRESNIDSAITLYLRDGETKEGMLEKFKGNTIATIQFLRDREFSQFDKKPSLSKKEESKKPARSAKQPAKQAKPVEKKIVEKKKSQTNQGDLF